MYLYDAMGNQVRDVVTSAGVTPAYNFSIYDGQNTLLAKYYTPTSSIAGFTDMHVAERYIYGSERLGTIFGTNVVSTWSSSPSVISPSFPPSLASPPTTSRRTITTCSNPLPKVFSTCE